MKSCPQYVIALLEDLEYELTRIQENISQEKYDSPFQNTGNAFKNDVFEVNAYYWGDDEKLINRPNFKCKDVEISWYKHFRRGTAINKKVSFRKMVNLYYECLLSLYKWENEYDPPFKKEESFNRKEELKALKGNRTYRVNPIKRLWLKWKYKH